ncbi:DUF4345 family protein [Caulobacter mirabilis]|nr:DUF4345 family protein [Caulobacter mirabilis]
MIPFILAVLACCLAGGMGGYVLARPDEALQRAGLAPAEDNRAALAGVRGFGGLLVLAHGGTAALLGYYPSVGASMALALALAWAGAAVGRAASTAIDRRVDGASIQALPFEVLMGLTLSLPFWAGRQFDPSPAVWV